MESKAFLFTSIPIVAIIIVFGYLNIEQEKSLNPITETASELCQSIEYNGEDRIDILFISSKEDAEHYTQVMFDAEPYKAYRSYFNTYVLEQEAECERYKGIAIVCNTRQTQALAKQCPHDYIVAVTEETPNIRSSAYGNVISINSVHQDSVHIHEWGHVLANLAEEYGGAKIPVGAQNCKSSCESFKDKTVTIDSCNQECSTSTHYRSIKEGVMRTLANSNYGEYNIAIITELLEKNKPKDTTITGNQILDQQTCNDKILAVEFLQSEDGLELNPSNVLQVGCVKDKGLAGNLCVGDVCYLDTLFTDAQDIATQETLEGETYLKPESPLIFYIEKNPLYPQVDVTLNSQLIKTINTLEAGATACKI